MSSTTSSTMLGRSWNAPTQGEVAASLASRVGVPELAGLAQQAVDAGVEHAYNHNFEKPLVGGRIKHKIGDDSSSDNEEDGGRLARATSIATGRKTMFEGLPDKKKKGGRLVKGSPKAAAWGKINPLTPRKMLGGCFASGGCPSSRSINACATSGRGGGEEAWCATRRLSLARAATFDTSDERRDGRRRGGGGVGGGLG